MHVGQHSRADYDHIVKSSVSATGDQYKPLLEELESIGYDLEVMGRRNYNKYLKSFCHAKHKTLNRTL